MGEILADHPVGGLGIEIVADVGGVGDEPVGILVVRVLPQRERSTADVGDGKARVEGLLERHAVQPRPILENPLLEALVRHFQSPVCREYLPGDRMTLTCGAGGL
jgi:hypothetical protein